ncbi:hypothetical protein [Saccharomonospora saliphila]|uniref:hypothetical protein n=1 Tax=Saccharomonospora saliphila TaxID=369829 RepID=UPI0003694171|nr:hypothetical protein [Saccharomonospora saliphila]
MSFSEIAPGIIVLGYLVVAALGTLGGKQRSRARVLSGTEATDDLQATVGEDVAGHPVPTERVARAQRLHRSGTRLRTLAWCLGVVVTLFWGQLALGLGRFLLVLTLVIVVPSVLVFVGSLVGRLRRARGGAPANPSWVWMFGGGAGLFLVVAALALTVNGLAHPLGYAHETRLHVTDSYDGTDSSRRTSTVSGIYHVDGEQRTLDRASWRGPGVAPEPGTVIDLSVAPLWPHPTATGTADSVLLLIIAACAVVPGGALLIGAVRERRTAADTRRSPRATTHSERGES